MINKFIFLLLLISNIVFAQQSNTQIKALHIIVDLMNAIETLNDTYVRDAFRLQDAINDTCSNCEFGVRKQHFSSSKQKKYISNSAEIQAMKAKFPILQQDSTPNGLKDYLVILIPYLKARDNVEIAIRKKAYNTINNVTPLLTIYIKNIDAYFEAHTNIDNYSYEHMYTNDKGWVKAKTILKEFEQVSLQYYNSMKILYSTMQDYADKQSLLHKNPISNAAKELRLSIQNLDTWEQQLIQGDYSKNQFHYNEMKRLNDIGKLKDTAFLKGTYGFNSGNSNGSFPKVRYNYFYSAMGSTIFHKNSTQKLDLNKKHPVADLYNDFVLSYNHVISDYNRFLELSDNNIMVEYETKELINKNEHILLRKPYCYAIFKYLETITDIPKLGKSFASINTNTKSKAINSYGYYLNKDGIYMPPKVTISQKSCFKPNCMGEVEKIVYDDVDVLHEGVDNMQDFPTSIIEEIMNKKIQEINKCNQDKDKIKNTPTIKKNTNTNNNKNSKNNAVYTVPTDISTALPHHLVYLLDASNSMQEANRIEEVKTNAISLINVQRSVDNISIVSFSDSSNVLVENKPCNLKQEISRIINDIRVDGGTNIEAGVKKSIELATTYKTKNGKTKILLFTDGSFELNKKTIKMISALQKEDMKFCIIYLGGAENTGIDEVYEPFCKKTKAVFYNVNNIKLKDILLKEAIE